MDKQIVSCADVDLSLGALKNSENVRITMVLFKGWIGVTAIWRQLADTAATALRSFISQREYSELAGSTGT